MATSPRPLRVLTLARTIGLSDGGAERIALELTRRLDQDRFRPYMCVTHAPFGGYDELADEAEAAVVAAGVPVLRLERRSTLDVPPWRHLYALLRRERIDVLHSHMFRSGVAGTLIGRIARVPVLIAHEHSWSFQGRPLRKLLDREVIARGSDAFVAVSREDERLMIEVERIAPEKIRFVPNGIPPLLRAHGTDVRSELGISPDAPVLGAVGVLRSEKAFEVLVHAAAILREEHPDVRVLIVGEGPERGMLEAEIARRGLGGVVILTGHRPDVPEILDALDVAILCSDREGSPLALTEYMAAGRPVVATRVGGIPAVIEDGVEGLLIEPRDPVALAAATGRLLRDRELGARLGAQARERQLAEFGIDAMVQRFEDLYVELYDAKLRRREHRDESAPRTPA